MQDLPECSIVCIYNAKNEPVGIGFLVSEMHLLTCAHVVARALYPSNWAASAFSETIPTETISLDFPLLEGGPTSSSAQVIKWLPMNALSKASSDIAVLKLIQERPRDSQVAPLYSLSKPWEHEVRAYGVPEDRDAGKWAKGSLLSRDKRGLVIIEDERQSGSPIQAGFSGGPIWSDELGAVVGMAVLQDTRPGVREALMIPASYLFKALPADVVLLKAQRPKSIVDIELEELDRLIIFCDRRNVLDDFENEFSKYWNVSTPSIFVIPMENRTEAVPECFLERLKLKEISKIVVECMKETGCEPPKNYEAFKIDIPVPEQTSEEMTLQTNLVAKLAELCYRTETFYIVYRTFRSEECRENPSGIEVYLRALARAGREQSKTDPTQRLLVIALIEHSNAPAPQKRQSLFAKFSGLFTHQSPKQAPKQVARRHCDWCWQLASNVGDSGVEYFELPPFKCVGKGDFNDWLNECCEKFFPTRGERLEFAKTIFIPPNDGSGEPCLDMETLIVKFRERYRYYRNQRDQNMHSGGSAE